MLLFLIFHDALKIVFAFCTDFACDHPYADVVLAYACLKRIICHLNSLAVNLFSAYADFYLFFTAVYHGCNKGHKYESLAITSFGRLWPCLKTR